MRRQLEREIDGCSMQPCNYGCWNLGWLVLHLWLTRRGLACCAQKTMLAQTACAACTTPSLWLHLFIGTADSTVLPPPGVRRSVRVLAVKRAARIQEWCRQRGSAAHDPEAWKQQAGPPKRRLRAKGDNSRGTNRLRGHPPKCDSLGRFSVPSVRDVVRALSTRN
ncbi:hypothetical protein FB451DRAFT_1261909 [Mycena latifolia]|nr:hypothetical protein FB451DRAFT_1261909 [Mycena latifolia]